MPRVSKDGNVRKLCGCTRWKECTHPWYVDVQTKTRGRYRKNLDVLLGRHCVDFAQAKTEARRAILAWESGASATDVLPGDRPTLTQLLTSYRKRPGASDAEEGQARRVERVVVLGVAFGQVPADEITREHLEAFRLARPKVTANRELAMLRAMFNWAVLGRLLPATPFKVGQVAAVRLTREDARTRRLQPGEETKLLAACEPGTDKRGRKWAGNPDLKDLIVAALETGCRLGELLSLQWHQVRADLFLPAGKTKAKKSRRVPISSVLLAVLDRRRTDPAGEELPGKAYVFGDAVGRKRESIKTAWRLLCRRGGIRDLHFHDLRREAGSRWMDAGVPLATIQRWLGHHNISQTSTYLAATGGGDEAAMLAFEKAQGRLTNVDVSAGSTQIEGDRSGDRVSEKTQQNLTNTDPVGVVH